MLSSVELAIEVMCSISFHTTSYRLRLPRSLHQDSLVVAISIHNSQRLFSKNDTIMPVQWHEENLKRLFLAVLAVNRVDIAAVARKWLELYGEYARQCKSGHC